MQDIVIVPTYDRPEMLWLCLQHLARCPEVAVGQIQVRVSIDAHYGHATPRGEIEEVLRRFPHFSMRTEARQPHHYSGNSYNLLTAFASAHHDGAERVYLVEDDVMVRPEFFGWHKHKLREAACSIGVVKEPHHGPYVSLGVGFQRDTLRYILPHVKDEYFQNMRQYCRMNFPPSKCDCEQDGLWARVLVGQSVVWAVEPLAQHVGWYGYHRRSSVRPHGTLVERYDQVCRALGSHAVLREWSKDFGDIHPLQSACN